MKRFKHFDGRVLFLILMFLHGPASYSQSPSVQKAAPARSAGNPFTMERLNSAIESVKKRRTPEKGWIDQIQRNGLAFRATAPELEQLKKAGASDRFLDAIKIAPQPAALVTSSSDRIPSPVKPKVGTLLVNCEPRECSVLVSGKTLGVTSEGKLSVVLPEGDVAFSVLEEGKEPGHKEAAARIKDGETARVNFKFPPSRELLEATGAALFQRMLASLGGESAIRDTGFLRAAGTLNIFDHEGQPLSWSMVSLMKLPDKGKFAVSRMGQKFEIFRTPEGFRWNKVPKGKEAQDIEDSLRILNEYQLVSVVERLKSPGFRMVAPHSALIKGEEAAFRAEGSPDSYSVTLDSDNRPKEIVLESKGLKSGITVLYSDFYNAGKSYYPKSTQIVLPGTPRRGVEAKYDKVEVNPTGISESDFIPKKSGMRLPGR